MMSRQLKVAFEEIQKRLNLPDYLSDICSVITLGGADTKVINELLNKFNIHHSIAKVDFLNLIMAYIGISLEDNLLTDDEKYCIQYLKRLFSIQPGDFYLHNKLQLESVIAYQLSRIYRDNFVNDEEALLKVDLQELFDLSFDEMNEYTKKEASISIQNGANPVNLDVYFTPGEYFKLRTK